MRKLKRKFYAKFWCDDGYIMTHSNFGVYGCKFGLPGRFG